MTLTQGFKESPVSQQDITVFISTEFFTAAQTLCHVGVFFCSCIFSSCFHLQLSFSFSLPFSFCPSLQLHHSYPALAPAVTLKQLSTVTMVMHTTVLDFCCHLIIIIITVTTVNVRLRDLSQSSDPGLICIM